MEIEIDRESVSMGDDVDEHWIRVEVDDAMTLGGFLDRFVRSGELPWIKWRAGLGWRLRTGHYGREGPVLADITLRTPEPPEIQCHVTRDTPLATLAEDADLPRLYFSRGPEH